MKEPRKRDRDPLFKKFAEADHDLASYNYFADAYGLTPERTENGSGRVVVHYQVMGRDPGSMAIWQATAKSGDDGYVHTELSFHDELKLVSLDHDVEGDEWRLTRHVEQVKLPGKLKRLIKSYGLSREEMSVALKGNKSIFAARDLMEYFHRRHVRDRDD